MKTAGTARIKIVGKVSGGSDYLENAKNIYSLLN